MNCPGLHCPGCGGGGGAAVVLVVAGAVAYAVHAVWHQIIELIHGILLVLEITGIVLVSAAGLAVLYAITRGVLYVRARIQHRPAPRQPIPAWVVHLGRRDDGQALENTARPLELESPRPSLAACRLAERQHHH